MSNIPKTLQQGSSLGRNIDADQNGKFEFFQAGNITRRTRMLPVSDRAVYDASMSRHIGRAEGLRCDSPG